MHLILVKVLEVTIEEISELAVLLKAIDTLLNGMYCMP